MSSSSGCPSLQTSQVLVDDNDSRIVYSGGWWLAKGVPGFECQTSTHGSGFNGVPSTANFTFEGVGVQVYGTIGRNDGSPVSTYQIDDLPSWTFNFTANGDTAYHLPFYASPELDPTNHTLVINVPEQLEKKAEIFLDYIIYEPILTSAPSSLSSSSSPSSTSSSAAVSQPVGAIVGGILGGVMSLILGVLLLRIMIRRRKSKIANLPAPDPFTPGSTNFFSATDKLSRNMQHLDRPPPEPFHHTDARMQLSAARMKHPPPYQP